MTNSSATRILAVGLLCLASLYACDEKRVPEKEPFELPKPVCTNDDYPEGQVAAKYGTAGETAGLAAQWPLTRTEEADSDDISHPFGPRYIGRYDFHAGIDIPAETGTNIYPVMPGVVTQRARWDGTSTGAGNSVTIQHAGGMLTSYLHMHTIVANMGDTLGWDDVVGTVGETGAVTPHLHLGFFETESSTRDERESKNPLEILPHTGPDEIQPTFQTNGEVHLLIPLQNMTVGSVTILDDCNKKLSTDYYEIVGRGWTPRKEQVQDSIHFEVNRAGRNFVLNLKPEGMDFRVHQVVLRDFNGEILLNASR